MPGTLTNQITKKYLEPRVLVVTDPRTDNQAIKEVAYCSIPVIALCDYLPAEWQQPMPCQLTTLRWVCSMLKLAHQ